MNIESSTAPRHFPTSIGSDELVEGLMLVRASTLKMIRLQLAMERQDRRGALEALDDLVALDRRLRDYLAGVPAGDERMLFRHELEAERALLNSEKLTLAAGVLLRAPEPLVEESEGADDWLGPADLPAEEQEPSRGRWWLAAVPALAAGLAAGAWFVGIPELQSWLTAALATIR
jgi:hypothetical protein